ncbi:mRNA-decapping enzyme 1B [Microplitis demolitor]|uniref:mRNA-decapping enzyme 1B n=1 Tax=Microplitis demolitor TaxID=69319 RepID=UPI0004CD8B61|nr:mRNA-decapping enzyme 1B [Microplitis demolitor]
MADVTELKMNMAALKRVDPYVKDILETATHVALYKFNAENNEWEKTDIEGALFVYSRNGEPYNSILIMNRLNTNNLVEPVTQRLDLELQEPFLLYRNSKCNIFGIWFYDKNECIRIAAILKQLVKHSDLSLKMNTSLKNKKQVINKTNNSFNNVDIFSMLSKAQENFNTSRESNGQDDNNTKTDKTSEDVSSFSHSRVNTTTGGLFDGTSQSVVDFFAKAKVNTGHYKPEHQQSPGNVHVAAEKPLLLTRLMSHPAAHTLEHIEKQQRSVTPQPAGIPNIVPPVTLPIASNFMKNGTPSSKTKKPITCSNNSELSSQILQDIEHVGKSNDTIIGNKSFHRIQSPLKNSINTVVNHNTPGQNVYKHAIYEIETPIDKVIKEELSVTKTLTDTISTLPMGFSSLDLDDKSIESEEAIGTRGLGPNAPALMPPVMFSATSPSEPNRLLVEPLTRNQLLQAFNYLIKNDPDFMMKLHDAYVKSFSEIYS